MSDIRERELIEYKRGLQERGYVVINDMQVSKSGIIFDIIYNHQEPYEGVVIGSHLVIHSM